MSRVHDFARYCGHLNRFWNAKVEDASARKIQWLDHESLWGLRFFVISLTVTAGDFHTRYPYSMIQIHLPTRFHIIVGCWRGEFVPTSSSATALLTPHVHNNCQRMWCFVRQDWTGSNYLNGRVECYSHLVWYMLARINLLFAICHFH